MSSGSSDFPRGWTISASAQGGSSATLTLPAGAGTHVLTDLTLRLIPLAPTIPFTQNAAAAAGSAAVITLAATIGLAWVIEVATASVLGNSPAAVFDPIFQIQSPAAFNLIQNQMLVAAGVGSRDEYSPPTPVVGAVGAAMILQFDRVCAAATSETINCAGYQSALGLAAATATAEILAGAAVLDSFDLSGGPQNAADELTISGAAIPAAGNGAMSVTFTTVCPAGWEQQIVAQGIDI